MHLPLPAPRFRPPFWGRGARVSLRGGRLHKGQRSAGPARLLVSRGLDPLAWRKADSGVFATRFSALPSRPWSFAMPFPLLSLASLLAMVTRPGLAGPVSTCDANGSLYFLGEWYSLDSDHCIQCECTAEGPACARTDCAALPPACIHVSHYPGDCCPRCERVGCEHRGQVYDLGQHFQVRQANERGV